VESQEPSAFASPNGEASQRPTIGVFDSGVGGLTVARAILEHLPAARLMYLADTAHVPYGPRPLPQVRGFALQIIDFLFAQGVDAVVMGCNMSIASGAREVAVQRYTQPIFEIIRPGCGAAQRASRLGKVGVIATQGTVNSGAYGRVLCELGVPHFIEQPCPAFVPLVERGSSDGPEVEAAVAEYLGPLRDAGIDTLVFGCTHYPFLRAAVEQFLGAEIALIDPAEQVAHEMAAYYGPAAHALDADPAGHRFFCSGDPDSLQREAQRFLGLPDIRVEQVNVPVEELVPSLEA